MFALGWIKIEEKFPAFIPILKLKKLQRIKIGLATLETREYAFLEEVQPNIRYGAFGENLHWKPCSDFGDS